MRTIIPFAAAIVVAIFANMSPALAGGNKVSASGTFVGASDHITTGGVSVVTTKAGAAVVILDSDFSLDGAPDPRVGFGKDGTFVEASDLGALENKTGLQSYVVPAGVDVAEFNEVYIWCKEFSVPLGVAALK